MIAVIVHHFVKPGWVATAQRRIAANGDLMAGTPGFLFRHAMLSHEDPCRLVTLTAWESVTHYEGWCERQRVAAADGNPTCAEETPYLRVATELFTFNRSLCYPQSAR